MTYRRILVCGGRKYTNRNLIYKTLNELLSDSADEYGMPFPDTCIIAGGAKGADEIAVDWAVVNWCQFEEYKANWDLYGKAAGMKRNQEMLLIGKPDLVLAFPGGRGTADMVARARKAGVEVMEIKDDSQ